VLAALKNNSEALEYVNETLRNDPEILAIVNKKNN